MKRPLTTLVVPAFNEADRLEAGFRRLTDAARDGAIDLDDLVVTYVDDGSTDATASVASELIATLPHGKVLVQDANRGKGAAIRAGVAAATTELVAFTDADMAIDPRQMPSLIKALSDAPVAVGSRAIRGHIDYGSWARTVAGRSFNRLVRLVSAVELRDTQCGWKGARTAHAKVLFHLTTINGFAFDVEFLARARLLGWGVTEVPVSWSDVTGSHVRLARDSVTMLADLVRARLVSASLPPLVGLRITADTSMTTIAAACEGTTLEAAPVVIDTSGSPCVLATLTDLESGRRSLEVLAGRIGGAIDTVRTEEVRSAAMLKPALTMRPAKD